VWRTAQQINGLRQSYHPQHTLHELGGGAAGYGNAAAARSLYEYTGTNNDW